MAHAAKRDAEFALCNLARHAGVELDPDDVSVELRSHPAHPSLLAVVHTLDALGFDHVAAAVDADSLVELAPAIAHTTAGLIVVESVAETSATIVNEQGRRRLSRRELEELCTGPVVFLDGEDRETHLRRRLVDAGRRRRRARWFAGLAAAAWLTGLTLLAWPEGLPTLALLILGVIGLTTTVALVGVELGVDGLLGQKLCRTNEPGRGCDAVLRSPLAAIAGVRVSELGLGYFLAQHAVLALAAACSTASVTVVAAVSLLVAPLPVLSVIYQAFVLRTWCRLCVLVQLILLAQAAVAGAILLDDPTLHGRAVFADAAIAAGVTLAWLAGRRAIFFAAGRPEIEAEFARLRRSPARIAALLHGAEPVELGELDGDVVRDPSAEMLIELVISFGCEGCRAAFLELDDLLARFPDVVGARVRFASRAADDDDARQRAVLDRALAGDHEGAWALLVAHFTGAPLAGHVAGHGSEPGTKDDEIEAAIEAQVAWCAEAGIELSPTRVVRGRLLDRSVSIADLGNFVALRPRARGGSG